MLLASSLLNSEEIKIHATLKQEILFIMQNSGQLLPKHVLLCHCWLCGSFM